MRLTLYEIEMTTRKACTGAGLPVGLGEDIGDAATWLAGRNHDGVEAVLKSMQAGMIKTEVKATGKGIMIFPDAHVAVCGPSVIDLLVGEESCHSVHVQNPDSVILLFGLAGVAAGRHGSVFQFDFANGSNMLVSADKVIENGLIPTTDGDVIVCCKRDEKPLSFAAMPNGGVEVNDETWRELSELAAKTYVPESGASRIAGAGAGLTDND